MLIPTKLLPKTTLFARQFRPSAIVLFIAKIKVLDDVAKACAEGELCFGTSGDGNGDLLQIGR